MCSYLSRANEAEYVHKEEIIKHFHSLYWSSVLFQARLHQLGMDACIFMVIISTAAVLGMELLVNCQWHLLVWFDIPEQNCVHCLLLDGWLVDISGCLLDAVYTMGVCPGSLLTTHIHISWLIIPCFQQHVTCSLDSLAVCDAWSLKSDRGYMRRVAILPYFDTYSMDWMSLMAQQPSTTAHGQAL